MCRLASRSGCRLRTMVIVTEAGAFDARGLGSVQLRTKGGFLQRAAVCDCVYWLANGCFACADVVE
jgi:hypothetical protein